MARRRKTKTRNMTEAEQQLVGMKAIKRDLDLGNGASVEAGETTYNQVQELIDEYNEILALGDAKLNQITAKDKELGKFCKKVKPAVGLKYGTDSNEYEMVGGTRDSERKKPGKKPKTPPVE